MKMAKYAENLKSQSIDSKIQRDIDDVKRTFQTIKWEFLNKLNAIEVAIIEKIPKKNQIQ